MISSSFLNIFVISGINRDMEKGFFKRILLPACICVCLAGVVCGDLGSHIDGIVGRKSNSKVAFGVKVIEASGGRVVYARNAGRGMIPASNMKVVVSAAALKYLGAGYEFTTKVGLIDNTLVVIGGGDPLLGDEATDKKYYRKKDWVVDDIVDILKQHNVKFIDEIVIDSTFFDNNRVHPNWPKDQLNKPYACEVSGVNYNENCVRITVKRVNSRAVVKVEPESDFIKIINKVKLTSKGNSAVGAYRNSVANKLMVSGKCRKEAGFDVAIEGPAAFFGFVLSKKLQSGGISAKKLTEKHVKSNKKIKILRVYKTPVADVLSRCNKDSFGLAAEVLVKTISAENTGGRINGEWRHGLNLVSRYMVGLGVDAGEFHLDDASGLSRENRLSPNAISTVVLDIYSS